MAARKVKEPWNAGSNKAGSGFFIADIGHGL